MHLCHKSTGEVGGARCRRSVDWMPLDATCAVQPRLTSPALPLQIVESHDLDTVSFHTCVLPSMEHALCLRVPDAGGGATRELVLRCAARERAEQVQDQLYAASLEHEQICRMERAQTFAVATEDTGGGDGATLDDSNSSSQHGSPATAAAPLLQQEAHGGPQPQASHKVDPQQGQQLPWSKAGAADETCAALTKASFGSPVAEDMEESRGGSRATEAASRGHRCGSRRRESEDGWQGLPSVLSPASPASPRPLGPCAAADDPMLSQPPPPVLPGLALVHKHSAQAPASPVASTRHRKHPSGEATVQLPKTVLLLPPEQLQAECSLPPRLHTARSRLGGEAVGSCMERFEAVVARLTAELALSRGACSSAPTTPKSAVPEPHPQTGRSSGGSMPEAPASETPPTAESAYSAACDACPTAGSALPRLAAVLQENGLLVQQHALLQVELGRMQGQLVAAAADNVRLAQEAAAAVRGLQAAAEAAADSAQREAQLRASLEGAVSQCETLARELAGLSGMLQTQTALCNELRWDRLLHTMPAA